MSNDQWGLKPIQSPRRNSLTDFFCPNEEWLWFMSAEQFHQILKFGRERGRQNLMKLFSRHELQRKGILDFED